MVTPSHNPPADGGFKYNPPNGGPAGSEATGWIQDRANEIITGGLKDVRRLPYTRALAAPTTGRYDFLGRYVADLPAVLDLDAVRAAGVRIGADPLGGASVAYWGRIAEQHRLDLTVVNPLTDPTWRFMTLDWDGKIRMDCSSPYAMASLIEQRDRFQIATGNDADADRHGIVTPDAGLMNPNHYLAAAIAYLYAHREQWPADAGRRQDTGVVRHDRPGGRRPRPRSWSKCPSASSGSWTGWSTARSASAARSPPGRPSCAATARCGRPTRTASSWPCSRPRSSR